MNIAANEDFEESGTAGANQSTMSTASTSKGFQNPNKNFSCTSSSSDSEAEQNFSCTSSSSDSEAEQNFSCTSSSSDSEAEQNFSCTSSSSDSEAEQEEPLRKKRKQDSQVYNQSEKWLAYENLKEEILEKIRKIEEERHTVDLLPCGTEWGRKRRRRQVAVSPPYVVYMLPDADIMEDWRLIRKLLERTD